MARDISLIQSQILDNIAADTVLGPLLTSTSKRAIFRLLSFVVAVAINMLEQLIDIFKTEVETIVASAAPGSTNWIQDRVLKFQYSTINPQIIQLVNFAPVYPSVDPTLRIISRCSVTTDLANSVVVKVATGEPPAALSGPQLSALQSYLNEIGDAGIQYVAKSLSADLVFIDAEIFYLGQYGSGISVAVIDAINAFLATNSQTNFNGKIKVSDLEQTILDVPGVTDVLLRNVSARDSATAFGSGTFLVLNNQVVSRFWNTVSGYIVEETTAGQTFADTLIFIPE